MMVKPPSKEHTEEVERLVREFNEKHPSPPTPPIPKTITLPLSGTHWALLQAVFPMTEEDWKLMYKVLEAMKPGLVCPKCGAKGHDNDEQ
jgi:hypothetical protein